MSQHLFKRSHGGFTSYEFDERRGEIIPHGTMTDDEIAEALAHHLSEKKADRMELLSAKMDQIAELLTKAIAILSAIEEKASAARSTDKPDTAE